MTESTSSLGATAALAEQAASLRFSDVPQEVLTIAKQCILDTIGVAIAGVDQPATRMVREFVVPEAGTGPASLFGMRERTSPRAAALVNGTAAHALDFDDVLTAMTAHPSAPVVPAIFALAEERRASGRSMLEAFISGFEVESRIGAAVAPSHYERGFHATGTVGTFGAAAGTAKLLGLDADAMTLSLGIAGAQAAGLKCQFGTMTKPLHAGKAAANGLLASGLAALGFTGSKAVIECDQGFAATQANELDHSVISSRFGSPWYLMQTLFKLHASCHFTHSIFDALHGIRHLVPVGDIERITLRVHPDLLSACNIPKPATGLEGKFSMRYVAALALTRGSADPSQFTDGAVQTPDLRALCDKVEIEPSADVHRFSAHCRLLAADGSVTTTAASSDQPRWSVHPDEQFPMLLAKFIALVEPVLGTEQASRVSDAICRLEDVPDVSAIFPGVDDQA